MEFEVRYASAAGVFKGFSLEHHYCGLRWVVEQQPWMKSHRSIMSWTQHTCIHIGRT